MFTTGAPDGRTREFASNIWASLKDGGVWVIPRSGLIYTKDEEGKRMILSARMPWFEELSVSALDLRQRQNDDHAGTTTMFAIIDVGVEDATG